MKVLVVGPDTLDRQEISAIVLGRYPDAEIVFQVDRPVDINRDEMVLLFDDIPPLPIRVSLEYKTVVHSPFPSIPAREKVMHPWSRRKKR